MNYGNCFNRKQWNQENRLQKKKDFMLTETHWNSFFRMSVFTDFFTNTIFFISIPAIGF